MEIAPHLSLPPGHAAILTYHSGFSQAPPGCPAATSLTGESHHDRTYDRNPRNLAGRAPRAAAGRERADRSEEHTSELQSLMRISYAVFCLKKKKQHKPK